MYIVIALFKVKVVQISTILIIPNMICSMAVFSLS